MLKLNSKFNYNLVISYKFQITGIRVVINIVKRNNIMTSI